MKFSDFQTESGTLKKMETDGFGDLTVADSLAVQVDPDFGWEQVFTDQQEQVTGRTTVVTSEDPADLRGFWDETHRDWVLTYKAKDWKVEEGTPRHNIGGNQLQHLELVMT